MQKFELVWKRKDFEKIAIEGIILLLVSLSKDNFGVMLIIYSAVAFEIILFLTNRRKKLLNYWQYYHQVGMNYRKFGKFHA